jgi:hypothetical protein
VVSDFPLTRYGEEYCVGVAVDQRVVYVRPVLRDVPGGGPLDERRLLQREDGHVKGRAFGHLFAVLVEDHPLPQVVVVADADRMVVVGPPYASRVPILGDREGGVGVGALVRGAFR